jgi:hypothetical protein
MILSTTGTTASNKPRNSPLKESRQLIKQGRRLKKSLQEQKYVPSVKVQDSPATASMKSVPQLDYCEVEADNMYYSTVLNVMD